MVTTFLRLCGPMQSWGTTGRFDLRGTEPWPTKSGVVGLIAAAMGIDRHGDVTSIADLRMGVAVLSDNQLATDYQTAIMSARSSPKNSDKTTQSWRSYIAGGDFLVSLTGENNLIQKVNDAVSDPVWPLFLGRRSYAPTLPIATGRVIPNSDLYGDIINYAKEIVMSKESENAMKHERRKVFAMTTVVDSDAARATTSIPDQPLGTFAERRYGRRYVRIDLTQLELEGGTT